MHQTNDIDDGYMGSGKLLRRAIEKYGPDNFNKEILFIFDNEEDMKTKEAELVNEEFVGRSDTYNICEGGKGGWSYVNTSGKNNPGRKHTQHTKDKLSISKTGTKHTDEAKEKMSLVMTTQRNTEEWKTKLSKSNKCEAQRKTLYRKVECPHCKKIGSYNAMKRFHFEKCKTVAATDAAPILKV